MSKTLAQELNRSAKDIEELADRLFSDREQEILKSIWGTTRLKILSAKQTADKGHAQSPRINSFADAVKCFEKDTTLKTKSHPHSNPDSSLYRTEGEINIIRLVLQEARHKTPEELSRPALTIVKPAQNKPPHPLDAP